MYFFQQIHLFLSTENYRVVINVNKFCNKFFLGVRRNFCQRFFNQLARKSYDRLLHELPSDVDILICEGTTLSRDGYIATTEHELEKEAISLFRDTEGPVFVLQSSMNIDRIVTMYRAAKQSGRIFLEELYMADITSAIGGSIPNPAFSDVYPFITSQRRYEGLCKYQNRVGKDFITKSKFVMCIRNSMTRYLKSLSEKMNFSGGLLVYSFWNGYKETDSMKEFLCECKKTWAKDSNAPHKWSCRCGDNKGLD